MTKCPDTAFPRLSCSCSECEGMREKLIDTRVRKARVMLAGGDERELLHLDITLRELVKELA